MDFLNGKFHESNHVEIPISRGDDGLLIRGFHIKLGQRPLGKAAKEASSAYIPKRHSKSTIRRFILIPGNS